MARRSAQQASLSACEESKLDLPVRSITNTPLQGAPSSALVNLHPHRRYGGELMLLLRLGHHTRGDHDTACWPSSHSAGPEAMGRPDVAQVAVSCSFSTAAASAAPILAAAGEAQQKVPACGTRSRVTTRLHSLWFPRERPVAPHKPMRSVCVCSSTQQTTHANAAHTLWSSLACRPASE